MQLTTLRLKTLDDVSLLSATTGTNASRSGPSLGSSMTQQFVTGHGATIAGAVLSGSNGRPPAIALIARWLARLDRARLGSRAASTVTQLLIFGRFNNKWLNWVDAHAATPPSLAVPTR